MIWMMKFLFEPPMNDIAQIIFALAILAAASKGVIWAFRCPKDSPNYRLPNLQIGIWKETKTENEKNK